MSQGFSFKYNQMKENSPTQNTGSENQDLSEGSNNIKNVCFALPDGTMQFLNYGYLVKAAYSPEENTIVLIFTSDTVKLEGIRLEYLFFDFMKHLPKYIMCVDKRYNAIEEKEKSVVNKIEINSNE